MILLWWNSARRFSDSSAKHHNSCRALPSFITFHSQPHCFGRHISRKAGGHATATRHGTVKEWFRSSVSEFKNSSGCPEFTSHGGYGFIEGAGRNRTTLPLSHITIMRNPQKLYSEKTGLWIWVPFQYCGVNIIVPFSSVISNAGGRRERGLCTERPCSGLGPSTQIPLDIPPINIPPCFGRSGNPDIFHLQIIRGRGRLKYFPCSGRSGKNKGEIFQGIRLIVSNWDAKDKLGLLDFRTSDSLLGGRRFFGEDF